MTKLYKSTQSKMSLIQPVKFRTWETGLFKMPRFQTGVLEMGVTVASGLCRIKDVTNKSFPMCFSDERNPRGYH